MLGSEAVARIQRRLGYRTDKEAEILAELQTSQRKLEGGVDVPSANGGIFTFYPWFLLSEILGRSTVVGEERVPVPTGFLSEAEPDALWYFVPATGETVADWNALAKGDLDALRASFPGVGAPRAYSLIGPYFRVLPVPDAVYQLKMLCYLRDTPVALGEENNWLKHAPDLLIADAGEQVAMNLQNAQASASFRAERAKEVLRLFIASEDRIHTNRVYVMGGED